MLGDLKVKLWGLHLLQASMNESYKLELEMLTECDSKSISNLK